MEPCCVDSQGWGWSHVELTVSDRGGAMLCRQSGIGVEPCCVDQWLIVSDMDGAM